MSHLALIAITKISLSVHVFWNVTNDVTQRILPQHLFSSSVGMTRQTPHTHQVGFPSGTRWTASQ
jgi:hypothetical protein